MQPTILNPVEIIDQAMKERRDSTDGCFCIPCMRINYILWSAREYLKTGARSEIKGSVEALWPQPS